MVNLITDIQMAITHLILSQINSIHFKLSSSNIEVHPTIFSPKNIHFFPLFAVLHRKAKKTWEI
jgi:hypothetical protein